MKNKRLTEALEMSAWGIVRLGGFVGTIVLALAHNFRKAL